MLRLLQHVHATEVQGSLVFLNLRNNRYDYLAPKDAAGVLELLRDDADPRLHDKRDSVLLRDQSTVDELKERGLVTEGEFGRPFLQIQHEAVLEEFPRMLGPDRPKIRTRYFWIFVRSVFEARALISILPLHWIITILKRRKNSTIDVRDTSSVARLVEVYRRLRPILFSRHDRCLVDSLSLFIFLQRFRVPATLCFGVRLEPFKAHAWVEHDGIVFDEMPANIHRYTRILEI